MGIYLSSPRKEKSSEDGENARVRYGLSSMQGWRTTMEDAVSILLYLYLPKSDFWMHMLFIMSYNWNFKYYLWALSFTSSYHYYHLVHLSIYLSIYLSVYMLIGKPLFMLLLEKVVNRVLQYKQEKVHARKERPPSKSRKAYEKMNLRRQGKYDLWLSYLIFHFFPVKSAIKNILPLSISFLRPLYFPGQWPVSDFAHVGKCLFVKSSLSSLVATNSDGGFSPSKPRNSMSFCLECTRGYIQASGNITTQFLLL